MVDAGGKFFTNSQVLLIDVDNDAILQTLPVGDDPDMVLSPRGDRLYISTLIRNSNSAGPRLFTYNTATGQLISDVPSPDALLHTLSTYGSAVAISYSGHFLYALKL